MKPTFEHRIASPAAEAPQNRRSLTTVFVKVARIFRNAALDLRYGRLLATVYWRNHDQANSDYGALRLMRFGPVGSEDVLVDIGCGGGRVINYWLSIGIGNSIVGLEADPGLAERARARLRRHGNVSVLTGDAVRNLPSGGSIFYMFNPFGRETMIELEHALRTATDRRAGCRIVYYNPKHLDAFRNGGHWDIEYVPNLGGAPGTMYQAVAYIRRSEASSGGRRGNGPFDMSRMVDLEELPPPA